MSVHNEILVIDDEPGFRTLVDKRLRREGYHTVLAQNAEEALVALWEKKAIGLVLLDVRLPVMNGMNVFEIIRKDFPDKKIIVASVFQRDEQRFLINDADDYYDKSEELSSLIFKVDKVLNQSMPGVLRREDKRTFKRMPVNVLASWEKGLYDESPASTHFLSYTKDLSLSGGKFVVGQDIRVGQHFTLALELPVNFMPLLIEGEVVWVNESEKSEHENIGNIEAGVRFIKCESPSDEEKLRNYLNIF